MRQTPNFLELFLAKFFDSLKVKSPGLYFAVVTIIVAVNLVINDVIFQELYISTFGQLPSWFNSALSIVSLIYLAVAGTRTTAIIDQSK